MKQNRLVKTTLLNAISVFLVFGLNCGICISGTIGSTVPGDIDGNGTVTISEVQQSINSFLGLSAPADISAILPGNWYVTNYESSGSITNGRISFNADGTYSIDYGTCLMTSDVGPSTGKWAVHQGTVLQMSNNIITGAKNFPLPLAYNSNQIISQQAGNTVILTKTPYYTPFTIAGKITDLSGAPVPGVKLSLSNSPSSAYSDSLGNYYIGGLINGSYNITPSLPGKVFSPINIPVQISGSNISNLNFTFNANSNYTTAALKLSINNLPAGITITGLQVHFSLPNGVVPVPLTGSDATDSVAFSGPSSGNQGSDKVASYDFPVATIGSTFSGLSSGGEFMTMNCTINPGTNIEVASFPALATIDVAIDANNNSIAGLTIPIVVTLQ